MAVNETLDSWVSNGWLQKHEGSAEETADLLAIVDRDIAECRTPGLSADWRLAIAYNGALQAARAALAAAGYRVPKSEPGHHHRVVESLRHTARLDSSKVDVLQRMKKKRNVSDYEVAGAVSEREADEMVALAGRVRDTVRAWLETEHPELLPRSSN